jgi:hypothetical protein
MRALDFWVDETPGTGIEPVTCALGKRCSIQLSYPGNALLYRDASMLIVLNPLWIF